MVWFDKNKRGYREEDEGLGRVRVVGTTTVHHHPLDLNPMTPRFVCVYKGRGMGMREGCAIEVHFCLVKTKKKKRMESFSLHTWGVKKLMQRKYDFVICYTMESYFCCFFCFYTPK